MKLNNFVTKSIAVLIALTCVFGCSGKKVDNGPVTKKVFEETIATGLTERWKLTDIKNGKNETKKDYKKYVNAELKVLKELESRKFKDAKVKELYDEYKSALDGQYKTVSNYWGTNAYDDEWTKAYNTRAEVLYKINEYVKIKVDKKDKDTLEDLLNTGRETKYLEDICKSIQFKKVKREYGTTTYRAQVKNITDRKYDNFYVEVALLDAKGNVLETQNATTENWFAGETHTFEITTDKKPKTVQVRSVSY
jgi:hypothetical protein